MILFVDEQICHSQQKQSCVLIGENRSRQSLQRGIVKEPGSYNEKSVKLVREMINHDRIGRAKVVQP